MVRQIEPEGNGWNPLPGRELKPIEVNEPSGSESGRQQRKSIADQICAEYAAAHQERIDAWMNEYRPRDVVDEILIRRAANLSWKMDLAERQDAAILRRRVLEAIAACEGEDAESLMTAATLASFDPTPAGEQRRRFQLALSREYLQAIKALSKIPRRG